MDTSSTQPSRTQTIGILTSGGDCPGLNAVIRGVAKAAIGRYGMNVIGILDGFRGLVENRTIVLDDKNLSGLLTEGGTILGTSRDKPHKMPMGSERLDMTSVAVENCGKHQLDCLVCLGGGGTQKNALHLHAEGGINVLTLPKTIDNDVAETDICFGFDTAMGIATEAIDRLHTTATSHHRIIICEIMGHNSGWLTLGAGVAGGADVILIPEMPYDIEKVADHLHNRRRTGKRFSIIAVAEGAPSVTMLREAEKVAERKNKSPQKILESSLQEGDTAAHLAEEITSLTGFETRLTTLGHVQRGGVPSATDRLLCTMMGATAADYLADGTYNVMVALKGDRCVPVPLKEVAGRKRTVPPDHPWIRAARLVGTCMGD
jgi:ATP-dependent phosphofructokinase / diphosphate-dependent phosphofructokinase